jgi:lipid-A-disaccharide synthase
MAEAGVTPVVDFDRLVVMGFVEIVSRLPFFIELRRRLRRLLTDDPPDLVIPIDYPGLNLWLTQEAHRHGIPVLYYIAPQLWAWRQERARILAENADRVAVVIPQEEPFLRDFGVDAVFVGHPLLDRLPTWETQEEAITALGADPERSILGLLPGSRPQEVGRMLKPFLQAAAEVSRRRPDVQVIVSSAPHVPADYYRPAAGTTLVHDSVRVLRASTAVLTKSGTTTVQAALTQTPMVIAYRAHPLSYYLARRLVQVDSIGMVNLLAGRRIAPEFVQWMPAAEIAEQLLPLLDHQADRRSEMVEALGKIKGMLGEPGAPDRVARLAAEILEGGS